MAAIASVRRNLVVAAWLSLLLVGFWCIGSPFDMERFGMTVPSQASQAEQVAKDDMLPPPPLSKRPVTPVSGPKTSRLHFLIPASQSNLQFCYNLASSGANRYPIPTLLGWNGKGEFDAAVTHLAKLRALKNYLDSLNAAEEADDLVMVVDGYDIIHQLPPEIIIERYFEVAAKANAHLAQRMGLPVKYILSRGMQQSVFFGPDKVCWPPDESAARCWAAPDSTLGRDSFGPSRGGDDIFATDPRWLNSGTIIGPVADLTKVINAVMREISTTYNPRFWQANSDQYYLSNVWGRQEYWRNQTFVGKSEALELSSTVERIIPEKETDNQETELHMAIEYESSLFQTKAGNELYLGYVQYNLADQSANVNIDLFGKGQSFRPYPIRMPDNVRTALINLYNSVPDAHPGASAESWLKLAHLGTNFVTKHIYGLWHCTGGKEALDGEYMKMWFYPFVKSLLRETVKSWKRNDPISTKLIDGRRWIAKRSFPNRGPSDDDDVEEYGGAWSDESGEPFVTWKEMCGHHEGILFWGQQATGL
ncbi:hypothetical protein E4U58_002176 [Claviceps cyperi]|nr:hypothetical protein E4U58_002176 [Claviceps cyperi]